MHQLIEQVFPDHWPGDTSLNPSTHKEGREKQMLIEHLLHARSLLAILYLCIVICVVFHAPPCTILISYFFSVVWNYNCGQSLDLKNTFLKDFIYIF